MQAESAYREALALAEKIGEPQLILRATTASPRSIWIAATACGPRNSWSERGSLCERTGLDPDTLLLLPFLG